MVFDYVQMVYDLAATKLPAHAYTKESMFAKQFGLTGIKINMSLIPAIAKGGIAPGLDANGNYVPQRAVRAVFPTDDSAFESMKSLIKAGLEEDAIIQGKRDARLSKIVDEIEKTLPKTEELIEDVEIEQADKDIEALEASDAMTKFSLRYKVIPTRKELERKDPVKVVDISTPKTTGTFAERRRQILKDAQEIIKKPYLNEDTQTFIFLTEKSYTHAFSNKGELQINAAEHLPEFIQNAILTHAEKPTHGSKYANGIYTFFAAAKQENILPVKLKVKEIAYSGQDIPANIKAYFEENSQDYVEAYDTVVLEVEEIERSPLGSAMHTNQNESAHSPNELPAIKVADLLNLVNSSAQKYIPQKVETRNSSRGTDNTSNGEQLTNALKETAHTDEIERTLPKTEEEIEATEVDALKSAYEKHGYNPYYFDSDAEVKFSRRVSKKDLPIDDVRRYTQTTYDKYGWAYVCGALNSYSGQAFLKAINETVVGTRPAVYNRYGDLKIVVGSDENHFDDVLIYCDEPRTTKESTVIHTVYVFSDTNRDDTEYIMEVLDGDPLQSEDVGEYFGDGAVIIYEKENQQSFSEARREKDRKIGSISKGDLGYSEDLQERKRGSSEDEGTLPDDGVKFSRRDTEYLSAVEAGDMETAQRMVDEAAKEAGYTIKAYHGTSRADRVGNVFRADRATSGPMAFFTDDRAIAENYSRNKKDTSIAYDTDYDTYETQFRASSQNGAKYTLDMPVHRAWGYIDLRKRNEIKRKAGQLRFDWDGDDDAFILDPNTQEANGGFQWQLKNARGNVITALEEQWLNSGNLFNNEVRFLEVLEMVGVKEELERVGFNLSFKDPNYREEKVYDTYLRITKPFDATKKATEAFIKRFENWIDKQPYGKYDRESQSADMWDKNNVSAESFAERMRDDLERGTSHAWTSIPDSMTDYLKHLHYDGIVDAGGKNGGVVHIVYIPFYSEQVKSADPVTYDDSGNIIPLSERFKHDNDDIRYQNRSEDEPSNRELLVNALIEIAQNDAERQKLEQYKAKVNEINELENHLKEVNAKIQEISFSKGKRDQAALRELKEEKIKTGNRLNIYDNQLLRIEASKPLKDILTRERQNFKKAQAENKKAFKKAKSEWNKALKTAQDEGKRTLRNAKAEWREAFKKAQAEGRELARQARTKEREKEGFPIWYS